MDQTQDHIIALEAERKHAEQLVLETNAELQETKRYLPRLIESSPDAVRSTAMV